MTSVARRSDHANYAHSSDEEPGADRNQLVRAWLVAGLRSGRKDRSRRPGTAIALGTFVFAGCVVAVMILRNWRSGFYILLDVASFRRSGAKVHGQQHGAVLRERRPGSAHVYFAIRSHTSGPRESPFGRNFFFFSMVFVWLGLIQIFNPNSPHVLYGLLGFKLYFLYVPLMYVGYALIRNDEDLRKFIVVNAVACRGDLGAGDHSSGDWTQLSESHDSGARTARSG